MGKKVEVEQKDGKESKEEIGKRGQKSRRRVREKKKKRENENRSSRRSRGRERKKNKRQEEVESEKEKEEKTTKRIAIMDLVGSVDAPVDLVQPLLNVVERLGVRDVVNHDDSVCAAVVA